MGEWQFILECPHPDGHPLIEELTVAKDPDGVGFTNVDTHFGPKWRLVSTSRSNCILSTKSYRQTKCTQQKRWKYEHKVVEVRIQARQITLDGGEGSQPIAFFEDKSFMDSVWIYRGIERTQSNFFGRGGPGGCGRGGRGRGGREWLA